MLIKSKHIIILLLSVLILSSCRTKKKTFNGTSTLKCADYDGSSTKTKEKKKTTQEQDEPMSPEEFKAMVESSKNGGPDDDCLMCGS